MGKKRVAKYGLDIEDCEYRRTIDDCYNEARRIFTSGQMHGKRLKFYPSHQRRVVQLFFEIRELGGYVEELRKIGFSGSAIYGWIDKYATPEQKATVAKKPKTRIATINLQQPYLAEPCEFVSIAKPGFWSRLWKAITG